MIRWALLPRFPHAVIFMDLGTEIRGLAYLGDKARGKHSLRLPLSGPFLARRRLEMRETPMSNAARVALGVILLMVGLVGCGASAIPVATAQQECERSGGAWRGGTCERGSGGGY